DNENIEISSDGSRVDFHRDVDDVKIDLNDVENIHFEALGGADNIVVDDVSGTDLSGAVTVDLEGTVGSGIGDGQVDTVTVNATAGNDMISVQSYNGSIFVFGSPTEVIIRHPEATDQLVIYGHGSDDVIMASQVEAGLISLTLRGGEGQDHLYGGLGNDVVF